MSLPVPNWIERLLGINSEPGEGLAWGIECIWRWPAWVTLLLIVFAVIFVTAIYWREGSRLTRSYRMMLAAIRLTLIAMALLMIAQVTLSLKRTGLPYVAVLVDDSLSMTTVDHDAEGTRQKLLGQRKQSGLKNAEMSRWNLARAILTENDAAFLHGIADNHQLRAYFLTDAQPAVVKNVPDLVEKLQSHVPAGQRTRLGAGVRAVLDDLRGTTPAGIVLLTDGINTDGPSLADAAEYARRRGVPIFPIGLGSDQPVRDLKLSDLLVDDIVFVGDAVNFECKLSGDGFEGKKVSIALRAKDKPDVLAKVETTVGPDGASKQIRLSYRPKKVGPFEFVLEAEPLEGELQTENNRLSRTIQVRKEKIRVLLVYAYPSFEFRYLRNMLQRDETIALSTVLQEADLEHASQDSSALRAFPTQRDALFAYDVVIFGDVNPSLLSASALQNIADFVDQPAKGGAVIFIAGPSYMPAAYRDTPLARLLPFSMANEKRRSPDEGMTRIGFVVQPTDLGLASPSMQLGDTPEETFKIWQSLATLYWLSELPELKPGVRVLAEHPTRLDKDGRHWPVFCLQYVGAGKVLFHATDETWRWRYRTGDAYFARYWMQTIRYLCRANLTDADHPVALTTDRRAYAPGEPIRFRARFADERLAPAEDDGVTMMVESVGRPSRQVTLHRTATGRGLFEHVMEKDSERFAPGDYHAWIIAPTLKSRTPSADFVVTSPTGEFAHLRMDAPELRLAAQQTGGRFYMFETADRLLDDLPPGRRVPIESLPPRPLWNRWPVLALFLGLLIAEWILRKRRGMV
jgi:hypothetical protein